MNKALVCLSIFGLALLFTLGLNIDSSYSQNKTNCFTLCYEKIPELCPDFIKLIDSYSADIRAHYQESYIYNREYCDSLCASWTDEVKKCVAKAKDCSNIKDHDGNCLYEPDTNPFIYDKKPKTNYNCVSTCKKYAKCAGYAEDAKPIDRQHAYNSCFGECQKWSKKTIKCMNKVEINGPASCSTLSMCGVKQYLGGN